MTRFHLPLLLMVIGALACLSACSDHEEPDPQYANWNVRNHDYFVSTMQKAKDTIASARATWGDAWTEHCCWRAYASTSMGDSVVGGITDSICVEVIERGTGSGCPLYTDSVLINYRGRLMASVNSLGDTVSTVFDHSGLYDDYEHVFSSATARPSTMAVSSTIRGVATALQHMHIGDLWRIYVPCELGYGSSPKDQVPAYSTLIFELQLKAYSRRGVSPPQWN